MSGSFNVFDGNVEAVQEAGAVEGGHGSPLYADAVCLIHIIKIFGTSIVRFLTFTVSHINLCLFTTRVTRPTL